MGEGAPCPGPCPQLPSGLSFPGPALGELEARARGCWLGLFEGLHGESRIWTEHCLLPVQSDRLFSCSAYEKNSVFYVLYRSLVIYVYSFWR